MSDDQLNPESVVNKFVEYSEATDLPQIQSSFFSLCSLIKVDPHAHKDFYSLLKSRLQHWKCQALWELLDTRASLPEYSNRTACKGKRVLVIGAGPVGLRAAIEASLLGAEVDVVEKRGSFSRNNVLHLWPFLINDLRALGAKKFYGKFCAGAIDHVCELYMDLQSECTYTCQLLSSILSPPSPSSPSSPPLLSLLFPSSPHSFPLPLSLPSSSPSQSNSLSHWLKT